jgi:uncharacterized protein YgbK (DUF1537 family)
MREANLVTVLQAQCQRKVGLIDYRTVALGEQAISARIAELQAQGVGIAVVDALSNKDLYQLGPALKNMRLVTAGSGVAIALPANWGIAPSPESAQLPPALGYKAIVSGSCSSATQGQVTHFLQHHPHQASQIDPLKWATHATALDIAQPVLQWAAQHLQQGPVLVYSTADAAGVQAAQTQLGQQAAGERMEQVLAHIAQGLVAMGVGQLVVAGGETSGACVQALHISHMHIGAQIDPGVPWCHAHIAMASHAGIHLSLKSGNFGTPDFFTKAFQSLHGPVL